MGYMAVATFGGLPLQQPIDLILREAAMQSIRNAPEGSDVPRVLETWKQRLKSEWQLWWVGEPSEQEEVLDTVVAMVHEELHGLIVLPRPSRFNAEDEQPTQ